MGRFTDSLKAEIAAYEESEWSGEIAGQPVTLYSKPLTTDDLTRISRRHPGFQQAPSLDGMIDLILLKARDDKGDRAFDKTDRPLLARLNATKIGSIFGDLFGSQLESQTEEDHEERVKN